MCSELFIGSMFNVNSLICEAYEAKVEKGLGV